MPSADDGVGKRESLHIVGKNVHFTVRTKHTHTHNGTLFSHEKGNPAVCNNMNLESTMLSEISQTEKIPCMILLIIKNLKNKTKQNKDPN